MSPDTPVLCADLVWRPAGDLVIGDELVAFDEETPQTPRGRRFRRAVVTGNSPKRVALVWVITPRGSVRCNGDHPWLARYSKECWRWVRTDDLRLGEEVMRAVDPWVVHRSWGAGWLAGLLGAGSAQVWEDVPLSGNYRSAAVTSVEPAGMGMVASLSTSTGTYIAAGFAMHNTALASAEKAVAKAETVAEARMKDVDKLAPFMSDLERQTERTKGLDRLTDAKFVTFRTLIESQAEKVALALAAADKAVSKAEASTERRFESVNEFRAQLSDQAARFISRVEFEALRETQATRLTDLTARVDKTEGRGAGLNAGWVYLLAALGALGTAVSLYLALKR